MRRIGSVKERLDSQNAENPALLEEGCAKRTRDASEFHSLFINSEGIHRIRWVLDC